MNVVFHAANLRDRFWRAFWRRQQKYLPPTAWVDISNCRFDGGADYPAIKIEVGREWKAAP